MYLGFAKKKKHHTRTTIAYKEKLIKHSRKMYNQYDFNYEKGHTNAIVKRPFLYDAARAKGLFFFGLRNTSRYLAKNFSESLIQKPAKVFTKLLAGCKLAPVNLKYTKVNYKRCLGQSYFHLGLKNKFKHRTNAIWEVNISGLIFDAYCYKLDPAYSGAWSNSLIAEKNQSVFNYSPTLKTSTL
ncbi:hypothetical protein BY458DRAFT_487878 [Sporodiniella umbellata]|nr:hypothetical protein BY458DRAFT_487878 [Sporodiniella umbellata]